MGSPPPTSKVSEVVLDKEVVEKEKDKMVNKEVDGELDKNVDFGKHHHTRICLHLHGIPLLDCFRPPG